MRQLLNAPPISVIIATRDRQQVLMRTLPTILRQEYPPGAFELILIDDGSSDGTAAWVRSLRAPCRVEVIEQGQEGPSAARNAGIEAARGQFQLFLDDDILCHPKLLREHAAGHQETPGGLVHGRISLADESPRTLAAYATGEWYDSRHAALVSLGQLRPDRDIFLNANTSFPASVMTELGGFDEDVPFPREDFELGLRVFRAGLAVHYRPQARAHELFAKSSPAFVRDARTHGAADVLICRKHPDYRPYTALCSSDPPSLGAAAARALFRRLPAGSEQLLNPATGCAERAMIRPRARHLGGRLLSIQRQMAFDRGATVQAGSASMLDQEFGRFLPVIMYHRVGAPVVGLHPDLTVSPTRFARQIKWLADRGYTAIRPSQWFDWCVGRRGLPRKPVLITFDDAYEELHEHALPLLRSHGFPAAVFVVTGQIGGFNEWESHASPRVRTMTGDQIVHWSQNEVEFGAHSRTHRNLADLGDRAVENEVNGSRDDLEALLDLPVRSFAYPYGAQDERTRSAVHGSYDLAFTTEPGVNVLGTPLHLLRRVPGGRRSTGPELEWSAWTGRVPMQSARSRLRVGRRIQQHDITVGPEPIRCPI